MKVGMDDPSSVEFVERRRAALERQEPCIFYADALVISIYVIFIVLLFPNNVFQTCYTDTNTSARCIIT